MNKALCVFLALCLGMGGLMMAPIADSETAGASANALTPHAPIRINNDTDLAAEAGSGNGTVWAPWVIENWEINGTGSRSGIYVGNTSGHFTIRNCSVYSINGSYVGDGYFSNAGILIYNATNGTIWNNTVFQNPGNGIAVWESNSFTVTSNYLYNNTADGIFLTSVEVCKVFNNSIANNSRGIACTWSNNNSFENNLVRDIDSRFGIYLGASTNITMINNEMSGCGIHLVQNFIQHWNTHTIDATNTVNGLPVHYRKNITGGTVPAGAGQVILANCTNMTVENQVFDNVCDGVSIGYCSNISVANCSFSNNIQAIWVYESDYNGVFNNIFMNNSESVMIEGSSNTMDRNYFDGNMRDIYFLTGNDNKVTYNTFRNCTGTPILSYLSWFNQISNNTFASNLGTIDVEWDGGGNRIFHNSFLGNTNPANDDGSTGSEWDNGYPSGGNYWSDYSGQDDYYGPNQDIIGKDGIGDSNYSISGLSNPVDNYPLMQPYTGQPLGPEVAQAPFALNYSPNGTGVSTDSPISISWNETMNWTSVESAFSYTDGVSNYTSANGTWTHDPVTNISGFDPDRNFGYEMQYFVTVNCTATDMNGNYLDQDGNGTGGCWPADVLVWNFTAVDEAPFVMSTTPANGQVDVDPFKPIKIMFSEAMNRTSVEKGFSYTNGTETWDDADGAVYWNAMETEFTYLPAETLPLNQTFTATLNGTLVRDAGGRLLDGGDLSWSFTTWLEPPAPHITDTYPPAGSFNVNVNTYINIAFDTEMNPATMEGSFSYTDGTDVWDFGNGTVDWFSENSLFSFQPDEQLRFDSTYTVRITSNVTSVYGKKLDGNDNGIPDASDDFVFTFTTTPEPPTVISHYPEENQMEVQISLAAINVNFSKVMSITSVTNAVSLYPPVPFTPSFSGGGMNLTLVLGAELLEGTQYRVTVLGTATDLAGIKLDGNSDGWAGDKFTFSFVTTGLVVPVYPQVISIFPGNNATEIPVEAYVGIAFNVPMNRTSVQSAFTFGNATVNLNGTFLWQSNGKSFKFIPTEPLAFNMTYYVTLQGTAKDEDGRPLINATEWHFTTVADTVPTDWTDWIIYGAIIFLAVMVIMLFMANRSLRRDLKRTRVKLKKLKREMGIKDEELPPEADKMPEEPAPESESDVKPDNPE